MHLRRSSWAGSMRKPRHRVGERGVDGELPHPAGRLPLVMKKARRRIRRAVRAYLSRSHYTLHPSAGENRVSPVRALGT
jgi:hypothetical protein